MDREKNRELINVLFDKAKWRDIVGRFVDVLKMNIFLVDFEGKVLLPPITDRYGWKQFGALCFDSASQKEGSNILEKFQRNDGYMDCGGQCGLQVFAVPINLPDGQEIAYMIVGPVILNKKKDKKFYEDAAKDFNIDSDKFVDSISEIRVVSHVAIKSIIELLSAVSRDVVELSMEKVQAVPEVSVKALDKESEGNLNQLLETLLDLALKMTNTECGSIMVMDPENKELTIRVYRGLDDERAHGARVKVGEGIAGIAAQQNSPFVIHGTKGGNRIKHLLNRKEIKDSIVMPLSSREKVLGVLNLHTKKEGNEVEASIPNLQYLSKLISAAFQSV